MTKFTSEEKLEATISYLKGHKSFTTLAKDLGTSTAVVRNWVKQYEHHGTEAFKKSYTSYSAQYKLDVLTYMNNNRTSPNETAAIFNIPDPSNIRKWRRLFEEKGIDGLQPGKRGRPSVKKETKKAKSIDNSLEALQEENERLRMENAYFKKVESLSSRKGSITRKIQAQVVHELRNEFPISKLIKIAGIKRSTYYYWTKKREDKYIEIKSLISTIFHEHKGRYGYRRITLEIQNRGIIINHKTVYRLMKTLGLKCLVRMKKYRSYQGKVGKIAPNILERNFVATQPNEKWVTDVTEFHLFGEKLYLSPILDLYNGEIISYNIETRPVYPLVSKMLDQAIDCLKEGDTPILHSDQGWHYQMRQFSYTLNSHGIKQSMSRKGNCLDNAVMESFFGVLKSELLYLQEFESMSHFKLELDNYIYYYNHKRIKAKLKGLSPVQYRVQTSLVA
ncbi:IS3 family transposase [Rossellomorea aquimaris]|uniref:IS3 family transposase n=1 Tax=Rossellomorea aquimaris TaxID=189382 RepID=UPI001CD2C80B|nr:IS3 family transposase [Rossellomorea aquimaris]MCA1055067.1 IS3 family transposase [Rossellomorea aquimaris]